MDDDQSLTDRNDWLPGSPLLPEGAEMQKSACTCGTTDLLTVSEVVTATSQAVKNGHYDGRRAADLEAA